MKPKRGREIALLSLPILLIGGVAFWNGKIGSWSGFGAPRGLDQGKPRLEITRWQKEMPTAVDFGRGISSRWTVTTWHGGACPVGRARPVNQFIEYPHNLVFAFKRKGKWQKMPVAYPQSEMDVQNYRRREKPVSHEIHLGLPLDLVPHDAEEVRLQGRLDGWMLCSSGSVDAPSAPVDVLLKAAGQPWPQFSGSRAPVLKFQSATHKWLHPNFAKNPFARDLEIEAIFSYSGARDGVLTKARSWIADVGGKEVAWTSGTLSRGNEAGLAYGYWDLSTRNLASKKGPFTLESWVYVDQSEWPIRVSIPLNLPKPLKPIR